MSPFISGHNAVLEAILARQRVRRLLVDAGARAGDPSTSDVLEAARTAGIPIERVDRARLNAIHPRHQGIAAEVEAFAYTPFATLLQRAQAAGDEALVLALDEIQDPHNLGAILRTALAVGVTGVVLPERRAVGVNSTVIRVSAGAAEHLAISQVPNLARGLEGLKQAGLWLVGLDAAAPNAYDEIDLTGPVAVVVGSEGNGLRRLIRETCDYVVRLPMAGTVESLNASVAASIVLYHIFRRRPNID